MKTRRSMTMLRYSGQLADRLALRGWVARDEEVLGESGNVGNSGSHYLIHLMSHYATELLHEPLCMA